MARIFDGRIFIGGRRYLSASLLFPVANFAKVVFKYLRNLATLAEGVYIYTENGSAGADDPSKCVYTIRASDDYSTTDILPPRRVRNPRGEKVATLYTRRVYLSS